MALKEIDVSTLESLEIPYGRSKTLSEYKKYDYEYDDPVEARSFYRHFKPLAIAQQKERQRPITMEVQSVSRLRHKTNEWLTCRVVYRSEDWRHSRINFSPSSQGVYKIPRFHVDIDPNTNEVRPGTAQVEELEAHFDIPFSKEKAQELLDMYAEDTEPGQNNLMIVDSSGRRFSCSRDEFVNEDYDMLVDIKTGFAAYLEEKEMGRNKKR